ncbi:MAG: methylmalonyl-CoA mutase family protein [Sphingomonadales bacterium]
MIDLEKLANQFEAAGQGDWRRLVDQALGTRSFDQALRSRTYDDLTIEPLYFDQGESWPEVPGLRRGPWDIRQLPLHPDPAQANRELLDDLKGGTTSVHLKFHPASWGGGEAGSGVIIRSQDDFDRVLKDFRPDIAGLSLDPGPEFMRATAMLDAYWQSRDGLKPEALHANWGIDPLGALARYGRLSGPLEGELKRLAALALFATDHWPNIEAVSVDACLYHNAGASEAQELAAALATGVAYLRAMEDKGLDPYLGSMEIGFRLSADSDVLMTVAKLRAFRSLWQAVLSSSGVAKPEPVALHVISSSRMLSCLDPWVNILRTTLAAFAAGIAGADAITLLPFTAPMGVPDGKARRLARNIQLLLMEESNLHRVADPLAGAYSIETLTAELSAAAWAQFQEIEGQGGMGAVIESGWFRGKIAGVVGERWRRLHCREELLTGVSSYPKLDETSPEVAVVDPTIYKAGEGGDPITLEDFEDPASERGPPAEAEPLGPIRLAEPFEDMRLRAWDWAAENKRNPRVLLVALGRNRDSIAPATYARNLFASAGFEAVLLASFEDEVALALALEGQDAEAAVICGAPEDCRERAGGVMAALRTAGIQPVYLVGEPEILREDDRAGLSGAFYEGVDVVVQLETLQDHLEGVS